MAPLHGPAKKVKCQVFGLVALSYGFLLLAKIAFLIFILDALPIKGSHRSSLAASEVGSLYRLGQSNFPKIYSVEV